MPQLDTQSIYIIIEWKTKCSVEKDRNDRVRFIETWFSSSFSFISNNHWIVFRALQVYNEQQSILYTTHSYICILLLVSVCSLSCCCMCAYVWVLFISVDVDSYYLFIIYFSARFLLHWLLLFCVFSFSFFKLSYGCVFSFFVVLYSLFVRLYCLCVCMCMCLCIRFVG